MSEEEQLGRLAYEAYCQSKYQRASEVMTWQQMPDFWQKNWVDAAQAVAQHVIDEMKSAVEASE